MHWNKIYRAEEVPLKVAKPFEVILFPSKVSLGVSTKKVIFLGTVFFNVSISKFAEGIYSSIF